MMKFSDIYKTAINAGMKADPRGLSVAKHDLERAQREYDKLSKKEKEFFDQARLENPYGDSRMLYGDPETKVRGILCGIDMEVGELLLADRLREKGEPIDLVIAHHPEGMGYTNLSDVMNIQPGIMAKAGVLENVAQGAMSDRIGQVARSVAPSNHYRSVMAAELLNIPYMCMHTPADNCVSTFVSEHLNKAKCDTVEDVIDALLEIPEYKLGAQRGFGPHIVSGSKERYAGKIYVDFTGGTSGAEDAYIRLSQAGISTIVAMHCPEKHIELAKKNHINIVIAGHISSDSLGCNLILDKFEAKGVKIYATSGLLRVSRNSKK